MCVCKYWPVCWSLYAMLRSVANKPWVDGRHRAIGCDWPQGVRHSSGISGSVPIWRAYPWTPGGVEWLHSLLSHWQCREACITSAVMGHWLKIHGIFSVQLPKSTYLKECHALSVNEDLLPKLTYPIMRKNMFACKYAFLCICMYSKCHGTCSDQAPREGGGVRKGQAHLTVNEGPQLAGCQIWFILRCSIHVIFYDKMCTI